MISSNPSTRDSRDRIHADDRGVAEVVGTILMFGVLIALVVLIQVSAVPGWNQQVEYEHNQRAQGDLVDLLDDVSAVAASGGTTSDAVELGVRFPTRPFLLNPAPADGTIRMAAGGVISIANATLVEGGNSYWDGDRVTFETMDLVYEPRYREYGNAPISILSATGLVNEFRADVDTVVVPVATADIVTGRTINLLSLHGSAAATGIDATSVDIHAVSAPVQPVQIAATTGPITLEVPTRLDQATWDDLLAAQPHVIGVSVDDAADVVTITLEQGVTYNLRLGRVDLGATPTMPAAKYLTKETVPTQAVKGDAVTLTVQVRDAYNNGVGNAAVTFEATTGVFGDGSTTVTVPVSATGRSTVEYVPTTTGSATVTAAIPGTPTDLTVVTWQLTVSEFGDTSDGGINPSGGTALALDHVNRQGGQVVLTFRNFDPDTDRTITDMRVNFYSSDSQGGPAGAYNPPAAVAITGPTGVAFQSSPHVIGAPFADLTTPWTIPAGAQGDLTLQFYEDVGGTTPESVEKGDFFVMTVVFADGRVATYFVGVPA